MDFPSSSAGKESTCNEGDLGSTPRLGRSFWEGYGNPLQYSCLENSMDSGAWWATDHGVAKSQTWLTKHSSASTISFMLITLQSTSLAPISSPSFRVSPLKDTCFQIQHSCKQNSFSLQKSFLIFWPWRHRFLHHFVEYVSYIHSFMWERDTCSVNLKERRVKHNLKGFFSSGLLRAFYMLMCIMKSPKWGLSIYCLQIYLIIGLFLEGPLRKNQLHRKAHKILS